MEESTPIAKNVESWTEKLSASKSMHSKMVRHNVNGYAYLTFINKDNQAENIYFSKGASEELMEGQVVDKDFLANYEIMDTTNADGEVRTKLVRKGGTRLELAELWD
jgi:hypothetical protein